MTLPTLFDPPATRAGSGVHLILVGAARWRVVDRSARIIGHLDARRSGGEVRYRARRYHPRSKRFRELGEFWRAEDAIDALRYSR